MANQREQYKYWKICLKYVCYTLHEIGRCIYHCWNSAIRRHHITLCTGECRSPLYWDEVCERNILEPQIVEKTVEVITKISERIKAAQDWLISYADKRRKELNFKVGDNVFLKVAPMKWVLRFGKKVKLRPRFIGRSRSWNE